MLLPWSGALPKERNRKGCPSVVSDSVRPHRQQPTRLRRPWDSPGKNTRMGYHFLLQCTKVKSERSRSVMSDSSRSHGLQPTRLLLPWDFLARVLEWVAILLSTLEASVQFSSVAQSCPTLCNLMDYTIHGILQARIPEWVAFPFSRGSS